MSVAESADAPAFIFPFRHSTLPLSETVFISVREMKLASFLQLNLLAFV